ncbi:MAG TPA: HXXEE domain-containing protein [Pyrinomonadaceae bacterium]|nr:HXXEE domain-containing protein [Pyrinomonadaceae bacterium]
MTPTVLSLRILALAMPLVFIAHVLEELPRFVAWFNGLVNPPISQAAFLSVNATALAITIIVAILVATIHDTLFGLIGVAWVGFLMLANGLFHIVATVALSRYCPGVATATVLYLPFSVLFIRAVVREFGLNSPVTSSVALLAGIPMYIHGYLIVFRGGRLF